MSSFKEQEAGCLPPTAEKVSPAAQVLINICHQLGCFSAPPDNYHGTNLDGLSGLPLERLTLSDLEKAVLLAAGFTRAPEFVRKHTGQLLESPQGQWLVCQPDGEKPLDQILNEILTSGTDTVGIRVTPEVKNTDTKPSRPYQKITHFDDPKLIRDKKGSIIGFYQRIDPSGKPTEPYTFSPNDHLELFIDPKPIKKDDIIQGGGFVFQLSLVTHEFQAFITTNGIDVRFVHDASTIASNMRQIVTGRFPTDTSSNETIRHFLWQDGLALQRLIEAIQSAYPDSSELNIEAHWAQTPRGLLVCAFDMEIPEKIAAQWRTHIATNRRFFPGSYNQAVLASYLPIIYNRFLSHQPIGD